MTKQKNTMDYSGNDTLSDLTREIVDNRKQSRDSFALEELELFKMRNIIHTIQQNKSSELWESIISNCNANENWNNLVERTEIFSGRLDLFLSETGLFYLAKDRADREYVNVGSVGVTQEGKSEFNASIANLSKGILPRGGGNQSCTTARINIINGQSPEGDNDIVRVHYYSVNEFAKQIFSFLIELGAKDIDFCELQKIDTKESLRQWVNKNKKNIEESPEIGKDDKGGKKVALLEYFVHLEDYIKRLGSKHKDYSFQELTSGSAKDKQRAEEYYSSVSYFLNPDDKKEKKYYSYATKKAEVFTSFKIGNEDPISNLQFLDTPGIGENKPGLERILAKSVSSDLDIIMAVRAARSDVQSDTARKLLITQLRTLLDKRPKSQNSLYFIQNLWDNAEEGTGEVEKKEIKKLLQVPQNLDKITIDDSHFKTINILKKIEILPNGSTNSNYPIHSYLFDIFKQLIPKIKEIDEEFFADAKKEYKSIQDDFDEIMKMFSEISHLLPSDDLSNQIDDVFKTVAEQWKNTCSEINDETIINQIHCDLETFCNQKTGVVLCNLLDVREDGIKDFDEEDIDNNYKFIDQFCKKNALAINRYVDKPSWDAGDELKCYAELKADLLKAIKEAILSHIDVEKAQEELVSAKNKIADVFRLTGKLSYISEVGGWWQTMADILEKEKFPKELTNLFADFASFSIDYHKILEESIVKVIQESRHADNFGTPDMYFFRNWEDTKKSIVHSLLCVESRVQSLVEEDVYKKKLAEVVSNVYKHINKLRELNTFGKQSEKTSLRKYWEGFYKKHAKEIFADNDQEKKRALISEWNKLCI